MRTASALAALIVLAGCSSDPAAAPTVTVTATESTAGPSKDCEYALDQADAALDADGALASAAQDALDASEDAIKALANNDPDAFDKAFAANEEAKREMDLKDRAAVQRIESYRAAAKKCRG